MNNTVIGFISCIISCISFGFMFAPLRNLDCKDGLSSQNRVVYVYQLVSLTLQMLINLTLRIFWNNKLYSNDVPRYKLNANCTVQLNKNRATFFYYDFTGFLCAVDFFTQFLLIFYRILCAVDSVYCDIRGWFRN